MAFIKKDVSDQDIEDLFENNNSEAFVDNPNSNEESLIPSELDVKSKQGNEIKRPDSYQPDKIHQKKLEIKKEEDELLKGGTPEKLLKVAGSVSKAIFNKIAEARQKAQLEEFISKQRKLPRIASNAKYKLYGADPKCTFHVFQVNNVLDGGRFLCSCKFCSQEKIFTEFQWKVYELENRQYM